MAKGDEEERNRKENSEFLRRINQGNYSNGLAVPTTGNNSYDQDQNDPNDVMPYKFVSPELSQPYPEARNYFSGQMPAGAARDRAARQVAEISKDPKKYIEENAPELNEEQSLIDKSKSILGQLFDYQDESDLELFNVNLSAVESVFDLAMQTIIGVEDTKNALLTAAVSALPGGVQTMDWGQVTNNQGFGDIIQGRLEEGSTPTVGQTAIASIAIEAKRIREGNARFSDVMLLNPVTAPFIAAALAADSSPLQADDWEEADLFDKEKREEDFSEGWENSMSRIFDTGVIFADPLVGLGVATKVVKFGALGRPGTRAYNRNLQSAAVPAQRVFDGVEESKNGSLVIDQLNLIDEGPDPQALARDFNDNFSQDLKPNVRVQFDESKMDPAVYSDLKNNKNPLVSQIFDFFEVKVREKGQPARRMQQKEIATNKSHRKNPNKEAFAKLMYDAKSPQEALLIVRALSGDTPSLAKVKKMNAARGEVIETYKTDYLRTLFGNAHPQKVAIVRSALERQRANLQQRIDVLQTSVRISQKGMDDIAQEGVTEVGKDVPFDELPEALKKSQVVAKQNMTSREAADKLQREKDEIIDIEKSVEAISEEIDEVVNGVRKDPGNPSSAAYNPKETDNIIESILADAMTEDKDVFSRLLADAIANNDAGNKKIKGLYSRKEIKQLEEIVDLEMRTPESDFLLGLEDTFNLIDTNMLVKPNWYSRRIVNSRRKRGKAAYEFSAEGTRILPKKINVAVQKEAKDGLTNPTLEVKREFWSSSKFEGTNTLQRNLRVWRYLGEKTPAGYISFSPAAISGLQDEFNAALDTDLYRGKGITVTENTAVRGKNGMQQTTQEIIVGGSAKKEIYINRMNQAVLKSSEDARIVFDNIQEEIYSDLAKAYGISKESIDQISKVVNRKTKDTIDQIKKHNYFVDPDATSVVPGDIQVVAFLESSFINGSYMHNFGALEKVLKKEVKVRGSASLDQLLSVPVNVGTEAYNLFNNVWRPLTLLRMGYTQRNVLEGVFRAMAFQSSIAPLLWPVKGTALGVRNIANTKKVDKAIVKVDTIVRDTDYFRSSEKLSKLGLERQKLRTIMYNNSEQRITAGRALKSDKDKYATKNDRDQRLYEIDDEIKELETSMSGSLPAYEASIKDTAFGKWRKKNINFLREKLKEEEAAQLHMVNQQRLETKAVFDSTGAAPANNDAVNYALLELQNMSLDTSQKLNNLILSPSYGTAAYREIAGRKIKIGSGQSIGPDGNYHNDAWVGPLENLNRKAASADGTVNQTLSLATGANQIFRDAQITHNVPIRPSSVTFKDGTYAEAITNAIETASSSIFYQALVKNDFDITQTAVNLMTDPQYRDGLLIHRSMQTGEGDLQYLSKIAERYLADDLAEEARLEIDDPNKLLKYERTINQEKIAEGRENLRSAQELETGAYSQKNIGVPANSEAAKKLMKRISDKTDTGNLAITAAEGDKGALRKFVDIDSDGTAYISDPEQLERYLIMTLDTVSAQMQRNPEFNELLNFRTVSKSRSDNPYTGGSEKVKQGRGATIANAPDAVPQTQKDVQNILNRFSDPDKSGMGYIIGSEVIHMQGKNAKKIYASFISKSFRFLSTIPEDAITRGPFYNGRYKASRNAMLETYLIRTNQLTSKGKPLTTKSGATIKGTMSHEKIKIPAGEMARIEAQSHRLALLETRRWMYTIERRTKLGKYGEWISPFISASQNTATVAGQILYRDPALAPAVYNIWRSPIALGIEDENGNLIMPMPPTIVREFLANNPSIPVFGGVMGKDDVMTMPKNSFNLFAPETGYGMIPRPGPLAGVAASEAMKASFIPVNVERPDLLASLMGDEAATQLWSETKKYIYGEYGGVSATALSGDKLIPTTISKVWGSTDEMSAKYAKYYAMHEQTQNMRIYSGDRDASDKISFDELNKRATNSMLFEAWGNFGAPSPLSPYPILTRPQISTSVNVMQNWYRDEMTRDPENASANFSNLFGDHLLSAVNQKVTRNTGGANPVATTISDINELDSLLREVSPFINGDNLDVLGILVNNRKPVETYNEDYEKSAFEILKAKNIPGRDEPWRQIQTGEMAMASRQASDGWKRYTDFVAIQDARLAAVGLKSLQSKAAAPFKAEKDMFILNMQENPELRGWAAAYTSGARDRISESIKVIEAGLKSNEFRNLLFSNGKERLFGIMGEYIEGRNAIQKVLEASGHGINHASNAFWKETWDAKRIEWRNQDERWSEIDTKYLTGDESPEFYGSNFTEGNIDDN